jgi:hypothetical protein
MGEGLMYLAFRRGIPVCVFRLVHVIMFVVFAAKEEAEEEEVVVDGGTKSALYAAVTN